jgi:hypothetical protein
MKITVCSIIRLEQALEYQLPLTAGKNSLIEKQEVFTP